MSIYIIKGEKTLSTGEVEVLDMLVTISLAEVEDWFESNLKSELPEESYTAHSGDDVQGILHNGVLFYYEEWASGDEPNSFEDVV